VPLWSLRVRQGLGRALVAEDAGAGGGDGGWCPAAQAILMGPGASLGGGARREPGGGGAGPGDPEHD
jgi:hypothetical protein